MPPPTPDRAPAPSTPEPRAPAAPILVLVPCLRDNYAYLLVDPARREAVVIDPGEAAPVEAALAAHGAPRLVAVLATHHHPDHVGGVPALAAARPDLEVIGSAYDRSRGRIPGQTRGLVEGDDVVFAGARLSALEVPGHTLGALAYVGAGLIFSGDTLFAGGCGRVFEGTMPQMRASLARLRALDPGLRLCPGHEYTADNLAFASRVEPASEALAARRAAVATLRSAGQPTVPCAMADELATNPFLRWESAAVRAFARSEGEAATDDDVFARVREAKNRA